MLGDRETAHCITVAHCKERIWDSRMEMQTQMQSWHANSHSGFVTLHTGWFMGLSEVKKNNVGCSCKLL